MGGPGSVTVTLPLNDVTDATDALEQGTLIALLNAHRNELTVLIVEEVDDESSV